MIYNLEQTEYLGVDTQIDSPSLTKYTKRGREAWGGRLRTREELTEASRCRSSPWANAHLAENVSNRYMRELGPR